MEPIEELELLAKWKGYIEGHAIDITKEHLNVPPGDRTLPPEAHQELQAALRAIKTLLCLKREGQASHALFLEQHIVLRGEVARRQEKNKLSQTKLGGLTRGALRQKQEQLLQAALDAYISHQNKAQ
jgi:hypothetical protein